MVSKAKLYIRLDALEAELEASLVPHLKDAVEGNNHLIFCTKVFNPFSDLSHRTDKLTEELIDIGSQILALRNKLGESSEGSVAERLCWYCREWGRLGSQHPSIAAALAKKFLAEIDEL